MVNLKKFQLHKIAYSVALSVLSIGTIGLSTYSQATAQGTHCINYVYQQGGTGTCVTYIQTLVNGWAATGVVKPSVAVDGDFGPATKKGVVQVQEFEGIAYDGVVGPHTWKALCNVLQWDAAVSYTPSKAVTNAYSKAGCSAIE